MRYRVSMEKIAERPPQIDARLAQQRQVALNARARVSANQIKTTYETVAGKALVWVFSWGRDEYPGIELGSVALLGRRVTWAAIKHWRVKRKNMPAWARDLLADHIEQRARQGLEIVAELRAYEPPARKPGGFCVVDPETKHRRGALGR